MNLGTDDLIGLILLGFAVGIIPMLVVTMTSFVKIVVVITLVRNAIGVQQVPPNMVINGLALVLSCYILSPIFFASQAALKVSGSESSTQKLLNVMDAAKGPFIGFLKQHANERERRYFKESAVLVWPREQAEKLKDDDIAVLAPAFVVSELSDAFRIGFLIYLAFIIIDLVIANILIAMGLNQASPTNIAIPFKLLLFVVLDGWSALLHGLLNTYKVAGS